MNNLFKTTKNSFKNLNEKKELLFQGEYFDVTNWIPNHPGGNVIKFYTEKGEDSTAAIIQFHHRSEEKVMKILKSLKKREKNENDMVLSPEVQARHDALTKDYLDIFNDAKSQNLFEPDYGHIGLRIMELVFYGLFFINLNFSSPILTAISRTFFLILASVRAAFLEHEYGHRSMTGNISVDKFIQSILMSGILGTSSCWWNSQHNRHHAMPQRHHRDVDLDTLPLLAFNSKIVENPKKDSNILIRNQHLLFFTVDTFLVLNFWKFILCPRYVLHKRLYLDMFFMCLHHYVAYLLIMSNFINIPMYLIAGWLGSIFIFGTFTLNHTHLPVTNEPKHWVEYCLEHTANVNPSRLVNWGMGHLNYQIEHHLYPQMPQLNCSKIQNRVKAMAKKHNIPYISNGYFQAIKIALDNLKHVAQEVTKLEEKLN